MTQNTRVWGYSAAKPLTPHDTAQVEENFNKAIYAAGAGVVVVQLPLGPPVTLAIAAGQILPIHFKVLKASGTTAKGLIGLGFS
jgi:hypothetical protein